MVGRITREDVGLAYEDLGTGELPLVLIHGVACHRGFWAPQLAHFSSDHRIVAVDLRGHGDSDAPVQRYSIDGFAADVAWMCDRLGVCQPVVVGHSLGGLVALALAADYGDQIRACVLIDSVLLPSGNRRSVIEQLVEKLRSADGPDALREYFSVFFGPHDDPARTEWILSQAVRTPPHVTSSVWEQSLTSWDDADVLRRCAIPVLYLDAGTPNADLTRAVRLRSELIIGRTVGSGHFSHLEVPEQVNAMIERFLAVGVPT